MGEKVSPRVAVRLAALLQIFHCSPKDREHQQLLWFCEVYRAVLIKSGIKSGIGSQLSLFLAVSVSPK